MKTKAMIKKLLESKELQNQPPVLMDIGAAGKLPEKWQLLAKYAVCIAFEADERDIAPVNEQSKGYKIKYIYPKIATVNEQEEEVFCLTKDPHCSSILEPKHGAFKEYGEDERFLVEQKQKLKAIRLDKALKEINLDYVDWFKTDSQGTDLRLFISLGLSIMNNVLVAEFEPGISDAYEGEDKLTDVLVFMNERPFWLSSIIWNGFIRGKMATKKNELRFWQKMFLNKLHKKAPCWLEICYLNNMKNQSKRNMLLGWIMAVINEEYIFALELAKAGQEQFADPIFKEMHLTSLSLISKLHWRLLVKFPVWILRKIKKILGS